MKNIFVVDGNLAIHPAKVKESDWKKAIFFAEIGGQSIVVKKGELTQISIDLTAYAGFETEEEAGFFQTKVRKEREKQRALRFLAKKSDGFQWKVGERVFSKDSLIEEVEKESEIGNLVVQKTAEFTDPDDDTPVTNQLGKRRICLLCDTEILCVKAGAGNVLCCDQETEVLNPRPLPSSD